jgi:ribosomal protein L9
LQNKERELLSLQRKLTQIAAQSKSLQEELFEKDSTILRKEMQIKKLYDEVTNQKLPTIKQSPSRIAKRPVDLESVNRSLQEKDMEI